MTDELEGIRVRVAEPGARGLADAVSRGIRDGVLPPGSTLPPIRTVAQVLDVSPSTVSAAWALLTRGGLVRGEGRRGTVVAQRAVFGPARYRRTLQYAASFDIDLSSELPDPDLLPDLARALGRIATPVPPQTYLDEPVLPALVDLLRADWPFVPDVVTVGDGVADALDLIAMTFLRFGDRVAVERLTDPGLLDLLEAAGARMVPIEADHDGPLPDSLAAAFADGARHVFLQPRDHQPVGLDIAPDRARALAGLVRAADARLVEIDYTGGVAPSPAASLGVHIPERTVHVKSFTHSHGSELRVSAIGGAADLVDALVQRRHLGQGWTSRLLQLLLIDLLTDPESATTVRRARAEYMRRRSALARELAARGVEVRHIGGTKLWVPVADEVGALVALASRGIGAAPGSPYAVEPEPQQHISLSATLLPLELAASVAAAVAAVSGARVRTSRG